MDMNSPTAAAPPPAEATGAHAVAPGLDLDAFAESAALKPHERELLARITKQPLPRTREEWITALERALAERI